MTASGNPGRLTNECGEQSQLALRLTFKLAERDKDMSEEQKRSSSFMQELDKWTDANVVTPLFNTDPEAGQWEETVEMVKKAIREKVLQSYKNGRIDRKSV